MCFNTILCRYLKMLFMIPLSPYLNILDYAYPSGHMFAVTSFYGTLAMESNRPWLHLATLTMLILYGQALVFFGYHNIDDVQTAFCFAMLSLFLYKNIDSIHKNIKLPLFIILSIIINMTMQPGIIPLQHQVQKVKEVTPSDGGLRVKKITHCQQTQGGTLRLSRSPVAQREALRRYLQAGIPRRHIRQRCWDRVQGVRGDR